MVFPFTKFFLSNPQSIKYCSASAEHIFVQYHYRLRGLQLCILAPTKDIGVSAAWYGALLHFTKWSQPTKLYSSYMLHILIK